MGATYRPGPECGVAPPRGVLIFYTIFVLLNISSLWNEEVNSVLRGLLASRGSGIGGPKAPGQGITMEKPFSCQQHQPISFELAKEMT